MRSKSASDRLESWKEIAAYLGRTVRTVQRWQQEGLPVHRHKHQRLSSVFALRHEVDAWRRQRAAAGALPSGCDHYCLLSSHHLRSRTAAGLRKSVECARLAINAQPLSAAAHAALALALSVRSSYSPGASSRSDARGADRGTARAATGSTSCEWALCARTRGAAVRLELAIGCDETRGRDCPSTRKCFSATLAGPSAPCGR